MSRRTAMNPPPSGPVAAPQLASQLANTLTRASVSVLASWLASWGAATGPDVSGFMAVLRDMGRFHGVQARRSSCPADGYISPCLSLCPPNDGVGRVGGLRRNCHRHADVASWIGPPVEEGQPAR